MKFKTICEDILKNNINIFGVNNDGDKLMFSSGLVMKILEGLKEQITDGDIDPEDSDAIHEYIDYEVGKKISKDSVASKSAKENRKQDKDKRQFTAEEQAIVIDLFDMNDYVYDEDSIIFNDVEKLINKGKKLTIKSTYDKKLNTTYTLKTFTTMYESLITEGRKPLNVIKMKSAFLSAPRKDTFSAWYIPELDTIIQFGFAEHSDFMQSYWPRNWHEGNEEYIVKATDSKINKIVKKYTKTLLKVLKKVHSDRLEYEDFYNIGWIRFNLYHGGCFITHNNSNKNAKKDEDVILRWIKQNIRESSVDYIEIEGGSSRQRRIESYDEITDSALTPMKGEELLDRGRSQMFGPGNYTRPKSTFIEMIERILGRLI